MDILTIQFGTSTISVPSSIIYVDIIPPAEEIKDLGLNS